ncbi:VPS10 domain-containing protein [Colwellia sp. MEBiC06753]
MKSILSLVAGAVLASSSLTVLAKDAPVIESSLFDNFKFRSIGPAFMSGRIADIEISPSNKNTWYVGVGSGGMFKTDNAGTTWQPIFDKQDVYSIGAVTIDPNNHQTVWVGTGENVGGRHVSFGDGIYVTYDGGQNWKNMGLGKSEHISEIIVHPSDSNTVWVAAQGPLWKKGGDRGLYKTTDGGKTWRKTLGDDQWTGVTDVVADLRNPDVMYAATWQRHRTVAAYLGGGPNTAIHKSTDGGETWVKLENGLPKSKLAKIGLAISPIDPDVLYAAIVLDRRKGAVYRSDNSGASWTKQSDAVAGGTGPHYYTELYVSPHNIDEIYLAGVRMQKSTDGGKTFNAMKEEYKHSDNHSLAFLKSDDDYLLMGSDGGIYESFDNGANWRFVSNLPILQYYKIALDDATPFYNVYGGTQDNNSQAGPTRTDKVQGIENGDWTVTLFGDGHQPATEPGNPNVFYSQWQQGNLVRVDKSTGSIVYVQPQPAKGEKPERFNWDAPILVSPHQPTRLYFASQRVWRSDDRGDSWTPISGDLTKNLPRIEQPIMGRTQSWDNAWDMFAMSKYSTITSLSESPLKEGLIYAGTDDGLIQITEDGGKSWRKLNVGKLPDVPDTAFINDIKADLHDENTVYIALDNHKFGDFKPYLLKSTNKGKSWKKLSSGIPDKHLVWRVVQDHLDPELMFAGTEFGLFVTVDGGKNWVELNGGLPTISFRDLAIQKRENDLVAASFGRGIYVLDDYQALRDISEQSLKQDAVIYPVRDALWYIEKMRLGGEKKGNAGASHYVADNPPFGATFTYYIKDVPKSLKEQRQATEKKLDEDAKNIPFPGWDKLTDEATQEAPMLQFVIKDQQGIVIRRLETKMTKGLNRFTWDLRYPTRDLVGDAEGFFTEEPAGFLALPGQYTVTLAAKVDGKVTPLAEPMPFSVKRLYNSELTEASHQQVSTFWRELEQAHAENSVLNNQLKVSEQRVKDLAVAVLRSQADVGAFEQQLAGIKTELAKLTYQYHGSKVKAEVGILDDHVTINQRLFAASLGTGLSSYGPTPTHKQSLAIAQAEINELASKLATLIEQKIVKLEAELKAVNAPMVKGQAL